MFTIVGALFSQERLEIQDGKIYYWAVSKWDLFIYYSDMYTFHFHKMGTTRVEN